MNRKARCKHTVVGFLQTCIQCYSMSELLCRSIPTSTCTRETSSCRQVVNSSRPASTSRRTCMRRWKYLDSSVEALTIAISPLFNHPGTHPKRYENSVYGKFVCTPYEYSLHTRKECRFGQRHGLQSLTLTSYFYKNIYRKFIYLYIYEYI